MNIVMIRIVNIFTLVTLCVSYHNIFDLGVDYYYISIICIFKYIFQNLSSMFKIFDYVFLTINIAVVIKLKSISRSLRLHVISLYRQYDFGIFLGHISNILLPCYLHETR